MIKARRIITILIPVILLAAALLFGSILLMRLFYIVVLVLGIAILFTRLNIHKLSADIPEPPEHLQVNNSFRWKVEYTNRDRLPKLFLHSSYITDLPGEPETTVLNVPGRGSYSWEPTIKCRQRGCYHLGPVTVSATDPFELFTRKITLASEKELIVYPATVDLPHFRSSSFSDYGSGVSYRSLSQQGPDASSVRDFSSGDSLQHIHWPSTARVGKMMVKLFDADRAYNASKKSWVLLDMHEESHCRRTEQASEDFAVTIAASVIKKQLQGGMRVGLLATSDNTYLIRPEKGEDHRWRVLKALALMQTGAATQLNDVVSNHLPIFRDNPLVIAVVTSATRNLLETIQRLRERTDMVIVICLDITGWGGLSLPVNRSSAITLLGAQIYHIRKGEELAAALESKVSYNRPIPVG